MLVLAVCLALGPLAQSTSEPPEDLFRDEEAFFALEQAIVTATRAPTPLVEAPAVISVISRAEIRRHGWRSVGEALRSVPGLYGWFDGVTWAYGVRGVSGGLRANSRVLKVLLNGQPVAYRYATTNWLGRELVPMAVVERIEVVRGPASALYGADAFLGVVNVITRSAESLQHGLIEAEGAIGDDPGERHLGGGTVAAGLTAGPFEGMFALAYTYEDRSGLTIPASSPNPRPHGDETQTSGDLAQPTSAIARLGVRLADDHRLELDGHLQLLDAHSEFSDWSVLTHDNRIALANGFVRLAYDGLVAPGHHLAGSVSWAHGRPLDREHLDTGSTLNSFVRDEGYHALDASAEYRWSAARWLTLTFGVDQSTVFYNLTSYFKVLERDVPNGPSTGDEIPHATQGEERFTNIGLFTQAVVSPVDWLVLTAGGRYDQHELYGAQFNGRAGLVLRPISQLTIKLLAGSSFKAPSALHLYAPQPTFFGGDIVGSPDLEPENATTFELALIARPVDGLTLSLAGYYNRLTDKVEFVQEGGSRRARNNTDIESFGVEADVRYQYGPFSVWLFFAWDRSRREPAPAEDPLFGDAVSGYPEWMGGGGAAYTIAPARLRLSASLHWATARRASQSNLREGAADYPLDAYAIFDLALSTAGLRLWGERETRVAFRVADVLDEAPIQPGYGGVDVPTTGRLFQLVISQEL